MKLQVEIDGESHVLELNGADYRFDETAGEASVEQIRPGVFSILLGAKSFTVHVAAAGEGFEAVCGDGATRLIAVSDTRDRRGASDGAVRKGPAILRAQMPGKIVKVLVEAGARVEAGQGLVVVEAMKMQNEVKAPKSGVVAKVLVAAGGTVAAGEALLVVE